MPISGANAFPDLADGFALSGQGGAIVKVKDDASGLEAAASATLRSTTDNLTISPNGAYIDLAVNEVYYGGTDPARHGLLGWSLPPFAGITATSLASGLIFLEKCWAHKDLTIARLWHFVDVAEVGATAGQNWMGLYDSSGNRLVISADQTTPFGSTGMKQVDLVSSQAFSKGDAFYIALLTNAATTQHGVRRAALNTLANMGQGSSGANLLHGAYGSGQTTLPSTITLASITATGAVPVSIGFS